jgi:hypothetical protein
MEWNPEAQPDLMAHLQICPLCRELWEDCQSIGRGMDAWEAEGPSELTAARILKLAEERRFPRIEPAPRRKRGFFLSRPLQIAAMFALVLGVGIYAQKWLQERGHQPFEKGKVPVSETAPSPFPAEAEPAMPLGVMPRAPAEAEQAKPAAPPPAATRAQPIPIIRGLPGPAPRMKNAPAEEKALGFKDGATSTPTKPAAGGRSAVAPAPVQEEAEKVEKASPVLQKMEAPAKALQAPAGAAETVAPPALEEKAPSDLEEPRHDKKADSAAQKNLVLAAKGKINIGDYQGALQDLVKAQQLGDNAEIDKLIELCRNKLKPENSP